jgi:hypothetical protein
MDGGGMTKIPTYDQVSAGGVAYRQIDGRTEVAIVRVEGRGGREDRWQLPGAGGETKRRRSPRA